MTHDGPYVTRDQLLAWLREHGVDPDDASAVFFDAASPRGGAVTLVVREYQRDADGKIRGIPGWDGAIEPVVVERRVPLRSLPGVGER